MKAAILAPGPSLSLLDAPPAADILIGVNRAILRFPCQWLAAMDYTTLKQLHREGATMPSLFTREATWANVKHKFGPFPQFITTDQIAIPVPRWALKTAPAALVLAAHLGASEIEVFGADWAVDAPDYDGFLIDGTERDQKRWDDEAAIWNDVVVYLAERGVKTCRHIAASPTP